MQKEQPCSHRLSQSSRNPSIHRVFRSQKLTFINQTYFIRPILLQNSRVVNV